jgi:hypothetical protein
MYYDNKFTIHSAVHGFARRRNFIAVHTADYTAIRATQDEVAVYQNELDRVTNVNSLLTEHAEKINLLPTI